MKLILVGAPGAGKGTQADVIREKLGIVQISTGNIIREQIKRGTELGLRMKAVIEAGDLVSDELVIDLVRARLGEDDCKNGFILDGFPRTIPQAAALDGITEIDRVLLIHVPDDVIMRRISGRRVCPLCGANYHIESKPPKSEGVCDADGSKLVIRADDRRDVVAGRLRVYHEQTEPLIDYYSRQGKLYKVEGQELVEDTTALTLKALGIAI